MINKFIVEKALKDAFIEDNHYIDVTSDLLLPKEARAKGVLTAKESGVICGIDVAHMAFMMVDNQCELLWHVKEGDAVSKGDILMTIEGDAQSILKAERIALNFMQRMSGVATLTRSFVDTLAGSKTKVVDTRKTTPLFRVFEKYAVLVGGGFNHRFNLSDCIMLKDNHIAVFGGITNAIEAARSRAGHTLKVEVEVEDLLQFEEALAAKADIIMLDNMSDAQMLACVQKRDAFYNAHGFYAILEGSGNVELKRLEQIKSIGLDVISSGALTHSYCVLDISLKLNFQVN